MPMVDIEAALDETKKITGANLKSQVLAGHFFDKFRDFIPWVSIDGLVIGGDTGYSITSNGTCLYIKSGDVANYATFCYNNCSWMKLLDSGKVITFDFPLTYIYSVIAQTIWVRMTYDTSNPPSETIAHFGWKIIDADLYASNADGTTQTITDTTVDLSSGFQRTRLKIVFTPGTDCKFYINDILRVTHTTNLPIVNNYYFHAYLRTTEAVSKNIYIGRVLLEKEHA